MSCPHTYFLETAACCNGVCEYGCPGCLKSSAITCKIAAKAAAVEADVGDVILVETGDGEASEGPALQSMDDLEIRAEDLPTDENLYRTLDPFYVADKALYEAAHNPGISFTELLLGNAEQGFALDHDALTASYVPVDPVSDQMGILGSSRGAAFDADALVARVLCRAKSSTCRPCFSVNCKESFWPRVDLCLAQYVWNACAQAQDLNLGLTPTSNTN